MTGESHNSFEPARWNACIKLLCRPIDSLDPVQRPAALVFQYDGRVQNGGHSSHWDSPNTDDAELLEALRSVGAHEQARILAEARLLKRCNASEEIEELDRRYYRLRPSIPEVLRRYFDTHRESFPK
ncbi:MAG TPA: hypothetical protein VNH84_21945 [Candidatus Saccharimonadales bacterium]|nr:hypothetical protein [Candidatus Saccharimonadales bacterium]